MLARAGLVIAATAGVARADEGGASFWLPGELGSFVAVPDDPGVSVPVSYLHVAASATGARQFRIGGLVVAGISTSTDLLYVTPTYTFATTIGGGWLSVGVELGLGHERVTASAVLNGSGGSELEVVRTDTTWGITDPQPTAELKWNAGVRNALVYVTCDLPVGTYTLNALANLGLNHFAIDGGGGFTYLDLEHGHEASILAGITYNFANPDTDYQSGVDSHVDAGAAQFFTKQLFLGLAGYAFVQLTGDHGSGAVLGDFRSRVFALGPQAGYDFHALGRTWSLSGRANFEFAAKHRPDGWNTWLTLVLPITAPPEKK